MTATAFADLSELAATLGLGRSVTKHSPIIRTLNRLSYFNLARDEQTVPGAPLAIGIYRHVYALPDRLARRLPETLHREHARAVAVVAA